jgi:hypothetical protein
LEQVALISLFVAIKGMICTTTPFIFKNMTKNSLKKQRPISQLGKVIARLLLKNVGELPIVILLGIKSFCTKRCTGA